MFKPIIGPYTLSAVENVDSGKKTYYVEVDNCILARITPEIIPDDLERHTTAQMFAHSYAMRQIIADIYAKGYDLPLGMYERMAEVLGLEFKPLGELVGE